MRFLLNPDCYHKMCESCVDRIFSHGPAPCPVAGCKRTLRKGRFRPLTFEDLHIEKEVDIRRGIAKVFNRREEDFEELRDYNDYLNEVEDITFNLINGIDVEAMKRKIAQYEEANRRDIEENRTRAVSDNKSFQVRQIAEQEAAKQRRAAAAREDNEEKREKLESRQDVINKLAAGKEADARKIAGQSQRAAMKKKQAAATAAVQEGTANANANSGLKFKGLKERVAPTPEKPYDPFGGLAMEKNYSIIQDDYKWEYFDMARKDPGIYAGGYDLKEYFSRSLTDAFAGLAVFVGDEIGANEKASDAVVATQTAAVAAKSNADDIF